MTMSGHALDHRKRMRALQMEDVLDWEDISVPVLEEAAARITSGIVLPSTSMKAPPMEQVLTKQPTSKLSGACL